MLDIQQLRNQKPLTTFSPHNRPEVYWIIYDNEVQILQPSFDEQSLNQFAETDSRNLPQKISANSVCKKEVIVSILNHIQKEYATHRFINLIDRQITRDSVENIIVAIEREFSNFKLTKRNLVFSIFIPSIPLAIQNYITNRAYFSKFIKFYHNREEENKSQSSSKVNSPQNSPKKMKMSRKASIIMGSHIFVDLRKGQEEIEQELIKQMKLDFIWLGVVSRLGTDIDNFTKAVIDEEDFTPEYIGFRDVFLGKVNQLLYNFSNRQPNLNNDKPANLNFGQILNESYKIASQQNQKICTLTEQLIRSRFNSRLILSDIVSSGNYLPLLTSRNYFNLLYIESDTLLRWQYFRAECEFQFSELAKILNIETFLTIDDYWYRKCVLKCLPSVKFIIDRGGQEVPYEEVISRNYKQIIPSYRPNFDEYFLSICNVLKERSGCLKEAVGSIIVKEKRIIATGYNGTPINCINCFNGGCKVCNNSYKMNTEVLSCSCIHAEYSCILEAGIKITPGSTLYSTKLPCLWCCKLIVQGRISKIVYVKSQYPHLEYENIGLAKQILTKANIELIEVHSTKYFISV